MFWRKKVQPASPAMPPQTDEDVRLRGKRAERLLRDADVMAAFVEIEQDIAAHMMSSAFNEAELREVLHAEARALQRIRYKLQEWADRGQMLTDE